MPTYKHYGESCALCGDWHPKRDMAKLYIGEGHNSYPTPRKIGCVCDNCLHKVYDFLEVSERQETERKPKRKNVPKCIGCDFCRQEAFHDGGKMHDYCHHPGLRLSGYKKRWIKSYERANTSPEWCPLRRGLKTDSEE